MIPATLIFTNLCVHQGDSIPLEELPILVNINVECDFRENMRLDTTQGEGQYHQHYSHMIVFSDG